MAYKLPHCTDCKRRTRRWGLCADCKALRALVSALLGDRGYRTDRPPVSSEAARREAVHRRRAAVLAEMDRGR